MQIRNRVVVLLYALLASAASLAQGTAGTAASTPKTESQQAATALLMEMAAQLGDAQKFQVNILVGYDSVQADGQKIEFGERRNVSVERPSFMLNEVHSSDGDNESILFDGESITVSHSESNVYARARQPGDIDATVKYFVGTLGMRLPLAVLLMSGFPEELSKRVLSVEYVEETDILGATAHHLAGRTADVDFQVWITADKPAVPLRIILTYRKDAEQPQFRANFVNWNFNPSFTQKMFRFEPLDGAREVPLATLFQVEAALSGDTAAPSTSGEQP